MKKLIVLCMLALSIACFGQDNPWPQNLYTAGVSYNNGASPAIAGTAMWAHLLSSNTGTYSATVVDILPSSTSPFAVTTNIGTGFAQQIFKVGTVPVMMTTSAGISVSGGNVGWNWTGGGSVPLRVQAGKNWVLMPNLRFVRSNLAGGSYQLVPGIMFGWGQ